MMKTKGIDLLIIQTSLGFLFLFIITPCYAFRNCPDTIHYNFECQSYLEQKLANQYPGMFSRNGQLLKIKLSNGKVKEFKNDGHETPDANHTEYYFVKYFPEIHYGLIYEQFYESGTYELINMGTGALIPINGDAEISPDKRRLAVFTFYESSLPGFSVYFVTEQGLVQEFKTDKTADGVTWKDNKTIDINFYDEVYSNRKGTLKFTGADEKYIGSWQLGPITK